MQTPNQSPFETVAAKHATSHSPMQSTTAANAQNPAQRYGLHIWLPTQHLATLLALTPQDLNRKASCGQ